MNQRFKELMIESMIETGRLQDGVQASYQRFGEKVVRECADYFGSEGDRRFEVDGNWIAKTIKRNFGVDE